MEIDATNLCQQLLQIGILSLSEKDQYNLRTYLRVHYDLDEPHLETMCEQMVRLLKDEQDAPDKKRHKVDENLQEIQQNCPLIMHRPVFERITDKMDIEALSVWCSTCKSARRYCKERFDDWECKIVYIVLLAGELDDENEDSFSVELELCYDRRLRNFFNSRLYETLQNAFGEFVGVKGNYDLIFKNSGGTEVGGEQGHSVGELDVDPEIVQEMARHPTVELRLWSNYERQVYDEKELVTFLENVFENIQENHLDKADHFEYYVS